MSWSDDASQLGAAAARVTPPPSRETPPSRPSPEVTSPAFPDFAATQAGGPLGRPGASPLGDVSTVAHLEQLFRRYGQLQRYVEWCDADIRRIQSVLPMLEPTFDGLIDDFYRAIESEPQAHRVITGGAAQIERLKGTLRWWVRDLFTGIYDAAYIERRWRVGMRHVEIGLEKIFVNMAMSRLRLGLVGHLCEHWEGSSIELSQTVRALNRLIDLELAIIQDAYLTEFNAKQQRAERLATIGQVAGGVAHELRNPLNVVKTSVYYLLNAKQLTPEKMAEHLKRIDRQVNVADGVITALSDFAKLPVPEVVPVELRTILQEAVELTVFPDSIQVSIEIAPYTPPILADAKQIQIVFNNLLRNAREAMPSGGRLRITAERLDGDVEVAVIDNGVGIPPAQLSRVMEPLFSTKSRGIGLGLAISRAIVDKHGGRLRVESEPNQGTRFMVRIPAGPERSERSLA